MFYNKYDGINFISETKIEAKIDAENRQEAILQRAKEDRQKYVTALNSIAEPIKIGTVICKLK